MCVCARLPVCIVNKLINVYLLSKFALKAGIYPGRETDGQLQSQTARRVGANVLFPFAIS